MDSMTNSMPRERTRLPWGPLLLLGVGAYHYGLLRSEGLFDVVTIHLLGVLLLALLMGVLLQFRHTVGRELERWLTMLAWGLIVLQAIMLGFPQVFRGQVPEWINANGVPVRQMTRTLRWEFMAMVVPAALCGLGAMVMHRRRWVFLAIVAGLHIAMGVWVVRHAPDPKIDVYLFQQEGPKELLAGRNPYAMDFENIYGPDTRVYSEEVKKGSRVNFGFPYPPMTMWSILPSYALTGESRYAHVLGWTITGLLIAALSRSRLATGMAVVILLNPMMFRVIESAWTESLFIPLLALTLLCAKRFPKWTPVVLGLLLASKQYFVVLAPVTLLLIPRPWTFAKLLKFYAISCAVGLAVSLPLVMWDVKAFWWSNVTIQIKQPFRGDSVSILAYIYNAYSPEVQKAWGDSLPSPWDKSAFMLAALCWPLVYWKLPRNPWGFAMATSLVMLVFLLFNRQSFLNYHILVSTALAMCVALIEGPREDFDGITR